ncbi:hypothetical protein SAMN05446927_4074 [Caballeronia arationis]|uniref:Transmembrane protein n=1 Tax=Caballeronia arationis TaxID=1777142 RepID=A0A7Z7I7Q3_9BURK|nr:hypothetical protein [Caballeronia arationis]SOE80824.1 hypothetical protein SAMN05446927_4074 [Caballeronia arationis]
MPPKLHSEPGTAAVAPASEIRSAGAVARRFAGALFIVAVVLCYLPLAPGFPIDSLDSAWQYALNEAIARHLVIGRDIVFTFGPFASVYTRQYHPATDVFDMSGNLLLGLAFASGLLCLAANSRKWPLPVVFVGLVTSTLYDPLYMAIPPLLLFVTARLAVHRDARFALQTTWFTDLAQALLASSLGLLPLVKGSFGALSLTIGGLAFLLQLRWSPRRALIGAALFAGTLCGGWWVAGQPLDALAHFFVSMQPIISGYTDAMSMSGRGKEIGSYIAIAAVTLLCSYRWALQSGRFVGSIFTLGLAISMFVAFKAGFVRHDAHALIAYGTLLFIAVFVAFQCSSVSAVLLIALGLTGAFLADNHYMDRRTLPARVSGALTAMGRGIEQRFDGSVVLRAQYDASVDAIRKSLVLPTLAGTWDVYPVSQNVPLANGVAWSPRPVFQSYSAYGARLADMNAAHLLSKSGPANILFSVGTIDQRLPAFDDSVSWLTMLNGYQLDGHAGGFIVLRRMADAVQPATLVPLKSMDTRLGELVPLPQSGGPLWLKIDLTPSFLGRIATTVLAIPEVRIELTFADGHVESFRYIASMGATGFLVSPFVRNTADFAALISSHGEARGLERPVAIRIVPRIRSGIFWSKRMPVQVSRVQIAGW